MGSRELLLRDPGGSRYSLHDNSYDDKGDGGKGAGDDEHGDPVGSRYSPHGKSPHGKADVDKSSDSNGVGDDDDQCPCLQAPPPTAR